MSSLVINWIKISYRCDALNIRLSKSQKKVVKRVNAFLISGDKPKTRSEANALDNKDQVTEAPAVKLDALKSTNDVNGSDQIPVKAKKLKSQDDPIKAKQIRIERRIQKLMACKSCSRDEAVDLMKSKHEVKKSKRRAKTLEEWLFPKTSSSPAHTLEVRFVSTLKDEYLETKDVSYDVYKTYQMSIHKDDIGSCTPKQFKRFLIDSPLILDKFNDADNVPNEFGSYHMQYWLDGTRLIAVGVIDILPNCVSSVYLYYDPDYSFLTLGTYSALR